MSFVQVKLRIPKGAPLSYQEADNNFRNLQEGTVPIGGLVPYASNLGIPNTYFECNGASLSATTYPELFAQLQYIWGGSGDDFNLPDFRGVFLRGFSGGSAHDTARTFATFQDQSVISHEHLLAGSYQSSQAGDGFWAWRVNAGQSSDTKTELFGGDETRPVNNTVIYIMKYASSTPNP